MKLSNKQTAKHQEHKVITKRANPNSPHYGYYHCNTCNKFVTWIPKEIYILEKREQKQNEIMWFGQYQGMPITDVPQDYLEWAIENIQNIDIEKLIREYYRREKMQ